MSTVREIGEDLCLIEQPMGDSCTGIAVLLGKEVGVIDTGLPSAAQEEIFPLLREAGRDIGDIGLIVNTHSHADHIGSNRELQETCGAGIAAHTSAIPWIEDLSAQRRDLWGLFPEYHPLESDEDQSALNSTVDTPLEDKDKIFIGDRLFELIHCPGHSPGSICLYDERDSLLIAGDSIQGHGSASAGLAMVLDLDGYAQSVQNLAGRPIRCMVRGHPYLPYAETCVLGEEQAREFLAESARAISRYLLVLFELMKNTPEGMTLGEVRDFMTREFGRGQQTIQAMFTTAVMLRRISEQGLIACGDDGHWRPS